VSDTTRHLIVTNRKGAAIDYARVNGISQRYIVCRLDGLRGLTLDGWRVHIVFDKTAQTTHWPDMIDQLYVLASMSGRPLESFLEQVSSE